MNTQQILATASLALERQGAGLVESDGDRLVVRGGIGTAGRTVELSIEPLREWLDAHPSQSRQGAASFFRGVGSIAVAPKPSRREANLTFTEVAAGLMPSIEGPLFPLGARLASGAEPFVEPYHSGLVVAHFVELDRGRLVVTLDHLTDWGVSRERVNKAALSLLFHRTEHARPTRVEGEAGSSCEAFRVGDGYDASRLLVLDSLLFQRCRSGLLVAIPATDVLLFTDAATDRDAQRHLRQTAESLYGESVWPLSDRLYRLTIDRIDAIDSF